MVSIDRWSLYASVIRQVLLYFFISIPTTGGGGGGGGGGIAMRCLATYSPLGIGVYLCNLVTSSLPLFLIEIRKSALSLLRLNLIIAFVFVEIIFSEWL